MKVTAEPTMEEIRKFNDKPVRLKMAESIYNFKHENGMKCSEE
jgi:hypothetical protein